MADRLGEQLLTLVKPCSRIKLRCARESRLGVLQTLLPYVPDCMP